jgi:CubicO group peptidase (beta-lactamase class C family)
MSPKQKFFRWIILLALVALLAAPLPAVAQTPAGQQPDLQAVDAFLQEQLHSNRIPGMAIAIVKGEEIIFQKGYGSAAAQQPITPQTQFYIGSVTKSFTALAALQLVEQGKLDLDAPVQKYLPWFRVADTEASAKISVRNLLNHTSGLSEQGDPNSAAYTASLEEQVSLLREAKLTAPVGKKYQYYNQNYRVLGLLIEQVSGQPYGQYLQEHIFTPLGMKNSTTDPTNAPNLAQGYTRVFGFPLAQPQIYIPGALPSGYLITSAEDMGRFLLAQINNRQAGGQPLLQPDTLATMRTPPPGITSDYGMGWMIMENGNTLVHGGALDRYQSFVAVGLKEKIGFVLLVNQNSMENMFFETNSVRDGLLELLNGKPPRSGGYGWIGWVLLALFALDLLNHARLFGKLRKPTLSPRPWHWISTLLGILIPLAVIFGIPPLMHALQGGAANWVDPFRLMPDLVTWLLLGMGLTLARNLICAYRLLNQRAARQMRIS